MDTKKFSRLVFEEILLLVLMSLLGFYIGLYTNATVAFNAPFVQIANLWLVALHGIMGLIILAVSALLFMKFARLRNAVITTYSAVGLASLLIAYASGILFVLGGTNIVFSFLMTAGFVIATVSYILILAMFRRVKKFS